jgi:uncharacterized membrane protein (DUF373 family)
MSEHKLPEEIDTTTSRADQLSQPPLFKAKWLTQLFEGGEEIIQLAVGILLFLGALGALGYTVYHFFAQIFSATVTIGPSGQTIHLSLGENIAEALINLISDLLLVLIIGEVFSTVLDFLRERAIYLKPFLFIGIISAARDILAISAGVVVLDGHGEDFTQSMIELGVNLGIILGLSLALRILRKEDAADRL